MNGNHLAQELPDTAYIDALYLGEDGHTDFSGNLHRDLHAHLNEFGANSPEVDDREELAVWVARRLLSGPSYWEIPPLVTILRIMSSERSLFRPASFALCGRAFAAVDRAPLSRPCPHEGTGHPDEDFAEGWASAIEAIAYGEDSWDALLEWKEERDCAVEDGEDPEEFEEDLPRPTVAGWDCPRYTAERAAEALTWFAEGHR